MSGNEKFEREFEAFMNEEDSRLAALYRKLPQPEPGAKLDASVRSMAHRVLNPQLVATPRTAAQRRRARWLPAFGAAAGIVLAAGIALRVETTWRNERNEVGAPVSDVITVRQLDVPPPAPAEPPPSPAPPMPQATAQSPPPTSAGKAQGGAASAFAEAATTVGAEREKKAEPPETPENRPGAAGGTLGKVENAAKPAAPPRAFPAPAQKRASEMDTVERKQIMAAGAWQNLHDRDERQAAKSADAASGRDDGAAKASAERYAQPTPTGSEAHLRKAPAAAAATTTTMPAAARPPPERAAPASEESAAESVMSAPPPPPPVMESAASMRAPQSAGSPASSPQGEVKTAPPPAMREMPRVAPTQQAADASSAAEATVTAKDDKLKARARSNDPNATLYPEHWLANIRTMLKENHRDEALRSLGEFRKMYPDYRLPDDLRELGKP